MLKNKPDIHLLISEEQSNPVSHIIDENGKKSFLYKVEDIILVNKNETFPNSCTYNAQDLYTLISCLEYIELTKKSKHH